MTNSGNNHNVWWKQVGAWALAVGAWVVGVLAATIPLYFTLQNDRDLQRTELGIANQHAAYTDVINTADAVLVPRYASWARAQDMSGGDDLSLEQRLENAREVLATFPEESENTRLFQEAATRLRLVIPADDAHLLSRLTETLNASASSVTADADLSPTDRLNNYTDAKLALVNEFRSDVLGEAALSDSEGARLNVLTEENLKLQAALRGMVKGAVGASLDGP